MGGNRSGRKPRYTAEVHQKIVNALRIGAYQCHAALAAGISESSLEKWLQKGRAGDERYTELARECDALKSQHANRLQGVITKAAIAGDWKAAAWDLERRYPKQYAKAPEPAVGVTFGDGEQKAKVEFYIPDNGRRPVEET